MTQKSQCKKIIEWLSEGNTLTTWEAWVRFRITTASQRVTELKRQRWPIESRMVKHGHSRVAEYFIPAAQAAKVRNKLANA